MTRGFLASLCLLWTGCGAGGDEAPPRDLPELPGRIVSLIPSASQTLQALGAGRLLVGRTDYDTAAAFAHLPSVGGGIHPSLEMLVDLEPDLVIRFAGESDPSTPARLDELGIPHLALRPDRIADVRETIRTLGRITGRQEAADSILDDLDRTLSDIQRRVEERVPVRVVYLLRGNPPWVAGPNTYIGEILEMVGATNVFQDLNALYGPVSPEELLARDIDLVLAPEGGEVPLPISDLPFRWVSPDVEFPGPHLAQSALELAGLVHPEVFR